MVPGLSTSSSILTASASLTSLPQNTTDDSSSSPATTRRRSTSSQPRQSPSRDPTETNPKQKQNEATVPVKADLLRDLPEWSENLEDEGVLASWDTPASTSRKSHSELPRKAVSEKHTVFVHFPKDRNCEVCKRTKITWVLCRKRIGDAALRAENFGDLKAAYHKVFSEGCESQNNHRYAVVVQDVATQ